MAAGGSIMVWLWIPAALACTPPDLFTVQSTATATAVAEITEWSIQIGRGSRADDPACNPVDTWMEVTVTLPADHGVKVGIEPQSDGAKPEIGNLEDQVFVAEGPIRFSWPETDDAAESTLHFGLFLTPVNAAGEEGRMWEIETFDEGGRDAWLAHDGSTLPDSAVVDTGSSEPASSSWFGCSSAPAWGGLPAILGRRRMVRADAHDE